MAWKARLTQGQGRTTPWKESGFVGIFEQSLKMGKGPATFRYPHWAIDTHAGSGHNADADCEGSPIGFIRAASRIGRRCCAFFCEQDPVRAAELCERIGAEEMPATVMTRVVPGDYRVALPQIAAFIRTREKPKYAIGTILCDPCGINDMHFGEVYDFCREYPRIDAIWHANFSLISSALGCKRKAKSSAQFQGFADWPELAELMAGFERPHWWVRNPVNMGGHRFCTLLGRNADVKKPPAPGFYRDDSVVGQSILAGLKRVATGDEPLFCGWW